jgi:thioredoxin
MATRIHNVTLESFENIVESNPLVLLYFWADWCAPCRIFAPVYEETAEKHTDVYFGKVNTEVATDLAQAFQVRSIPTLMAFKNDTLVFEQAGVFSPAMMEDLIEKLKA